MPPVLQKTIREIHQRLRALETREYAEVVGPGSVINAEYLTLALHAVLTAERRFVDGDGLVGTDAGANADYTLDIDLVAAWSGLEFVAGELRIDEDADFIWTGTHTFNANILLAGGVTIDGMDPSAFLVTYAAHDHSAGDPTQVDHTDLVGVAADQHHAQVHIVNSTGPHAEAGLAVGNVLRASGAAAFSFAQLQHGDLGGVGANDHHNEVHVVNSTGPHAEAGLTISHVLRVSGAAAFAFAELQHDDLGGVGTDDHHNEDHVLLSAPHTDTLAAAVVDGDVIIGNVTPRWSRLAIAIPAANVRNVLGVDNGELRPSWKTALDAVNPANIGAAAPGTSLIFSHRDHVHNHPAALGVNLHHNEVHVVNSTGPHAEAGLTIGHVLRASAAAVFSFAALQAGDIPGLGGVPALTLDLANAAGAAATYIQTDASIAIFDAVVPGTIQCDDAANTGAAAFAARRDHQHAIVNAIAVNIANANAEGTEYTFSRSDHVHNHPAALGANLHHTQIHDVVGGDHTLTGAQWNLVGATALNTIGLLLALDDVSAPAEAILKSTATGGLTLIDLTLTNDLLLADGAVVGITGNERIQFHATGYVAVMGANLGVGITQADSRVHIKDGPGGEQLRMERGTDIIRFVQSGEHLYLYNGDASILYMVWRDDGKVGIQTATPTNVFSINEGSGNALADGWDTYVSTMPKEDVIELVNRDLLTAFHNMKPYSYRRTPFVSAGELRNAAVNEFGLERWLMAFPENEYQGGRLRTCPDGEMLRFLDALGDQLRNERRSLPEWQRRHYGLLAEDSAVIQEHFPGVFTTDEEDRIVSYSLNNYVGMLHSVVWELNSHALDADAEREAIREQIGILENQLALLDRPA